MKKKSPIVMAIIIACSLISINSYAQYYEMANGLQSTIGPILSGSGNYKGFVEAGYSHTLGNYKGDFIEITTSQGYNYKSWFYMGAGLGVDILFAHKNTNWGEGMIAPPDKEKGENSLTTAVMLPIFTDFRFNVGSSSSSTKASFYIDLKIGCSFLLSNKYIAIGDGYLNNQEYFFLRPSLGVRIPVNANKPKQAIDLGISYKLLTSNYWFRYNNNITLQALGANISYEW